jgi:glycosyltransferase involved in cell wall biosynthesis
LNVLLTANHLNTGGISTYILTLARGLTALGHRVYVLTGGGNLVERIEAEGIKHLSLGFRTKSEVDPRIYLSLPRVVALIRSERIDVVHAQTRVTQVMAHFLSRQTGVPFISTCHGFFKPRFFRRLFPCWGRQVIAISGPVREHLINDFHVDPAKVVLIPNGIDLVQFTILPLDTKKEIRERYGLKGGPIVGIIARLSDVKGHVFLIKAFKEVLSKYPSARLVIVGEGPEEKKLRDLVIELALSKSVDFFKIINRTADLLPIFDVFVMPSLQEGLGLSVLEAQAAGLPVVASRVGGLPDVIEHGQTGLLVEPQNVHGLTAAICELLDHPAKAWDMGRRARLFVESKFSAHQMTQKTLNLYESLKRE